MPLWITPTIDALNDARASKLVEAMRTKALAVGQTDPMPRIIATVVDEVRSCIGFCASTRLDIDVTTIPANLKDLVVQKIIRVLKGRLLQLLTVDEITDERTYQTRLKQLTECAWPVDKTDTPIATTPTQARSSSPRITARERETQAHL